jgi:hypothetical protein
LEKHDHSRDTGAQDGGRLDLRSVVVTGTGAAGSVPPKLAKRLLALRRQRNEIASQLESWVM